MTALTVCMEIQKVETSEIFFVKGVKSGNFASTETGIIWKMEIACL